MKGRYKNEHNVDNYLVKTINSCKMEEDRDMSASKGKTSSKELVSK